MSTPGDTTSVARAPASRRLGTSEPATITPGSSKTARTALRVSKSRNRKSIPVSVASGGTAVESGGSRHSPNG